VINLAHINFHAYQIDMHYVYRAPDGKEYDRYTWDPQDMVDILNDIYNRPIIERQKKFNGWFIVLDELRVRKRYIVGRFKYAEYGYKSNLIHADTLATRDNPRDIREGEEKHIHFYIRKSDGFMLLQGHQRVTQHKITEYIDSLARHKIQSLEYTYVFISLLLDTDFTAKIRNLDKITALSLEITSKVPASAESEVIQVMQNTIDELEGTHVQLMFKAKYKRDGLKQVIPFVQKYDRKQGITSIKVIGLKDGAEQTISVEQYREKHPRNCPVNANNILITPMVYRIMTLIGRSRSALNVQQRRQR
jgi:hypothetical protein